MITNVAKPIRIPVKFISNKFCYRAAKVAINSKRNAGAIQEKIAMKWYVSVQMGTEACDCTG